MSNDILLLLQYLSVRGTPPGVSTDLFSQLPNEHVKMVTYCYGRKT